MKNKKPFSSEEFRAIYSKVPRLCVDLVVKTPKGLVLSLRAIKPYKGKWHLPGGTVHYKESIVDAIQRVAKEEIHSRVKIRELLGYMEFPNEEKERGFGHTVTMAFLCFAEGTGLKPNEEALQIRIFRQLPPGLIKEQDAFLRPIWQKLKFLV